MVAGLGDQLRRAAQSHAPEVPEANELLVLGVGGSGICGDYLAHLASRHGSRVTTHRSYGLPGWVGAVKPTVLAISYSGDTEETLSAVEDASRQSLGIVAVTTGGRLAEMASAGGWPLVTIPAGLQPRAALGHVLGACLRIAEAASLIPSPVAALEEAASMVDSLTSEGGAGWAFATDLAGDLALRAVAIYGSTGLTAPVARRWKTQVNENGKRPAWYSLFPELDHNEIAGWTADPGVNRRVGIVVLRDRDDGPAIDKRVRLTSEVTGGAVDWVGEVESQGDSALARMMTLTVIGDMMSVALADAGGVDAVPVAAIEDLKKKLREEL